MILDDVATYLAAQSTRFDVGVTLTKHKMPDTPSTVTTLYETPGLFPLHNFSTGTGTRYFERPGLQIITRSTDYQTARTTIEDAFTVLDGVANTALPTSTGVLFAAIDAVQSPFDLGEDGNERTKMSVNFTVTKSTG